MIPHRAAILSALTSYLQGTTMSRPLCAACGDRPAMYFTLCAVCRQLQLNERAPLPPIVGGAAAPYRPADDPDRCELPDDDDLDADGDEEPLA